MQILFQIYASSAIRVSEPSESPVPTQAAAAWHHLQWPGKSNGARQTRSLSVAEMGLRPHGAVLTTVLVVCTVTDSAKYADSDRVVTVTAAVKLEF